MVFWTVVIYGYDECLSARPDIRYPPVLVYDTNLALAVALRLSRNTLMDAFSVIRLYAFANEP